ncbi:MAG: hypothetical protein HYR71_04215 [Chloroflexi bacterium]|nr:hypothetical protein [Chloroflexota bacterium]
MGSGLAFTLNISQSGMLLETDKPLEPAAGLLLEMVTPLYTFIANAVAVYSFQIEEHRFRIGLSLQKVIEGGWQPIADMPAVEERE